MVVVAGVSGAECRGQRSGGGWMELGRVVMIASLGVPPAWDNTLDGGCWGRNLEDVERRQCFSCSQEQAISARKGLVGMIQRCGGVCPTLRVPAGLEGCRTELELGTRMRRC